MSDLLIFFSRENGILRESSIIHVDMGIRVHAMSAAAIMTSIRRGGVVKHVQPSKREQMRDEGGPRCPIGFAMADFLRLDSVPFV